MKKYLLLLSILSISPVFAKDQTRVSNQIYNSPVAIQEQLSKIEQMHLTECRRFEMIKEDFPELRNKTCDFILKQDRINTQIRYDFYPGNYKK